MELSRSKLIFAGVGISVFVALGIYLKANLQWRPNARAVYRIGWQDVPPFQYKAEDGAPAGLAIDLVRDAARRRGIQLEWVWYPGSSEGALRNGDVDLWPLITITPERQRQKAIYISKPYLQHDYSLLVRASSQYIQLQDLEAASISHLDLNSSRLPAIFPRARLVQVASHKESIESVCAGRVDAAFMDEFSAGAILLSGISCAQPLREISMPALRSKLGVGSTLRLAAVADEIRRGIDATALDGDLQKILTNGGYFSSRNVEYFSALLDAQRRERWLRLAAALFACLLIATVLAADHIRRQRNRIHQSEAVLRASELKLRLLANNLSEMVLAYDMDRRLIFANPGVEKITGYSVDALRNANFICWVHPDDQSRMLGYWDKLFQASSYRDEEYRLITKDGQLKWAAATWGPIYDETGRQVGVEGSERDITERKRAEQVLGESERRLQEEATLRASEERFRTLADTAPVMMWVSGPDKLCTFFNRGWLAFTGSTMDQALGNGWGGRVHPDDRERCYTSYSAAFDARRTFQTECRLRRTDGEYRWVVATGVPRFEPSGALAGYVGTCLDITDVKRVHEEALARQKLESLGVLAGGIAHDFNNMLGSILANSELVLSELPVGSAAENGVESIKNVADRAAAIVSQMMAYAGKENALLEPLNLTELVKEMLQLLEVSISKHAKLKLDLPENLPAVRANAAQIRQVVMNLITNASEALGEREGVISVTLAAAQPTPDQPAENTPGFLQNGYLRLVVSDSGCGMTEEIQARIFDPYFTTKFSGRGLGLAAVQGIIRDHGGTISVRSAPGEGSRFEVTLPCTDQPAPNNRDIVVHPSTRNGTVLVIDDEDQLRIAASKFLRRQGFPVLEADDGRRGVDLFRTNEHEIDVVLLDLTLPGMHGREVLEELRRIRPDVKVIVTTAYSQESALKAITGHQPWAFIRKPYQLNDLVNLLREACLKETE